MESLLLILFIAAALPLCYFTASLAFDEIKTNWKKLFKVRFISLVPLIVIAFNLPLFSFILFSFIFLFLVITCLMAEPNKLVDSLVLFILALFGLLIQSNSDLIIVSAWAYSVFSVPSWLIKDKKIS